MDFWTYSCINCLRTIPEQESLYRRYRDQGLTVVGVHTPEFRFEADAGNVGRAVRDLGITYPVVLDPRFATWDAFGTRYWPTTYLIDRRGHVRDLHVGEGDEARTEAIIRRLLAVPGDSPAAPRRAIAPPGPHAVRTPETYVGALRVQRLTPDQTLAPGASARYAAPARLAPDQLAFDGGWLVGDEAAQAEDGAALELRFRAAGVYLVLDGDGRRRVGRVLLDGRPPTADAGRGGRGSRRAARGGGPPPLPAAPAPPRPLRADAHRAGAGDPRLRLHLRLRRSLGTRASAVSQKATTSATQASRSSGWHASTTWCT